MTDPQPPYPEKVFLPERFKDVPFEELPPAMQQRILHQMPPPEPTSP